MAKYRDDSGNSSGPLKGIGCTTITQGNTTWIYYDCGCSFSHRHFLNNGWLDTETLSSEQCGYHHYSVNHF